MFKSLRTIGSWLLMGLLLFNLTGCAQNNKNRKNPKASPKPIIVKEQKEYKLGVVLSDNDLGANNAVLAGLIRAKKDLGIDYRAMKPKELATHEDSVRYLAENEYDLVLGVGPGPTQAINKLAKEYSDVKFATTEDIPENHNNVAYYDFREQEGGFLVGVLAASLTNTNKISFIGGAENELTRRYLSGFNQGVNYINKIQKRADVPGSVYGDVYNQQSLQTKGKDKKYQPKPLVKVLKAYVGYFDKAFRQPEKAKVLTLNQLDKGVDVIFQVAGYSGQGVIQAANERGVKVMGTSFNPKEKTTGLIITNVAKNLEEATYNLAKNIKSGKYGSGAIPLGLKENALQLTPIDVLPKEYQGKPPATFTIPEELANTISFLKQQIIAGKIIIKE